MKDMEAPYSGKYLYYKGKGTYQCKVCALPIFCSETKFISGHGWLSFWDVINCENIVLKHNEVLCRRCDNHLGYIFSDGPPEKTGKRYCINSSSLNFIALKE